MNDNTFIVTGLSLNMEFRTSYYDTSSTEFLMFASALEKVLLSVIDQDIITGVKLLKASPGTTILSYS